MTILHHTKHQKSSPVRSCLKALDRFCVKAHGFFQDHMATRFEGRKGQFNMASIGGRHRNHIELVGMQGF